MNNEIIQATSNEADTKTAIFSPSGLQKLQAFAEVMAQGRTTVPAHLAGKPADCLAVALQAAQWGMNPFAVAQKTHLVNGTLGYEAQLVNAVVTSSNAVQGRFKYEYGGDWARIAGQTTDRDESGLFVRVGAVLRGETEVTWGEPLYLVEVVTRNSPLWKSKPQQQLGYLAVKYWARLYTPDVILGVYTPDELEQKPRVERDITPARSRADLNNLINSKQEPAEDKPGDEPMHKQANAERTPDELLLDFTAAAGNAKSTAELDKFYTYAAKQLAGTTELLDKATDVYLIRQSEITEATAQE